MQKHNENNYVFIYIFYANGNCCLIFLSSETDTIKPYLFLPFAFLLLSESKCLFQALASLNLPFEVTLTLFFTQLLVFKVIVFKLKYKDNIILVRALQ